MKTPKALLVLVAFMVLAASLLATGYTIAEADSIALGGPDTATPTSLPTDGDGNSRDNGDGEGGGRTGGSPTSTSNLVSYVESFPRGIVLMSDDGGLEWVFSGVGGDDISYVISLIKDDDGEAILQCQKIDGEGEDIGEPVSVYLEPNPGVNDEDEVEYTYIPESSIPREMKNKYGEAGLRADILAVDDYERVATVRIPLNLLVKYEDYDFEKNPPQAEEEVNDVLPSPGTSVLDYDAYARSLIDELSSSSREFRNELENLESDRAARVVLDIEYDWIESRWKMQSRNDASVYSSDHEMVNTENSDFSVIGIIVLMAVSLCSLAMNVLLALRRARR